MFTAHRVCRCGCLRLGSSKDWLAVGVRALYELLCLDCSARKHSRLFEGANVQYGAWSVESGVDPVRERPANQRGTGEDHRRNVCALIWHVERRREYEHECGTGTDSEERQKTPACEDNQPTIPLQKMRAMRLGFSAENAIGACAAPAGFVDCGGTEFARYAGSWSMR